MCEGQKKKGQLLKYIIDLKTKKLREMTALHNLKVA